LYHVVILLKKEGYIGLEKFVAFFLA